MAVALIPLLAITYLPILHEEQIKQWPTAPSISYLAAQIEQETCVSLKSSGCWNPRTELKTDREYGFGLSQITVTSKFNNFLEAKKWDKALADWQWEDRYNPHYQTRALVVYMRNLNNQVNGAYDINNQYAFALSAYNGGMGGVIKDRSLCKMTTGCDSSLWWGNVENTSLKAKIAVNGYGQSFFQINRGYVVNIMNVRYKKYDEYLNIKIE
jgi:hypothetical protein